MDEVSEDSRSPAEIWANKICILAQAMNRCDNVPLAEAFRQVLVLEHHSIEKLKLDTGNVAKDGGAYIRTEAS